MGWAASTTGDELGRLGTKPFGYVVGIRIVREPLSMCTPGRGNEPMVAPIAHKQDLVTAGKAR
jgi:hypothetical protein